MRLDREIATYRKQLPELLAHEGKFVVIHGEDVGGIFDSMNDALHFAYGTYGDDLFLAREIRETDPVYYFPLRYHLCRSKPDQP
jgi:hypothetical protein